MSPHEITNMAASVHQRLKNHAGAAGRLFNEVLLTYGIERFLYRLSRSAYRDRFVLKGGLMLMVWRSAIHRPTKDIDLLGHVPNDPATVAAAIGEVCVQGVEDDGLVFDAETVQSGPIGLDKAYDGVRVTFQGRLGRARIHMQVDVGFGDVVFPPEREVEVPSVLGFPAARLRAYRRETVVAEKLEAMIHHDEANSRVRDFLDVWLLSQQFDFTGEELTQAIRTTFGARGTDPDPNAVCFSAAFGDDRDRQAMWSRLLQRSQIEGAPPTFAEVIAAVSGFVQPLLVAVRDGVVLDGVWTPPGPWREG